MTDRPTFSQEWLDYYIPETVAYDAEGFPDLEHAVMRNLIAVDLGFEHGLPDQVIVDRLEVATSIKRLHELEVDPIPGNFDLEHMQRIHHHLFQDIYPWAGEIRTAPQDWKMYKLGPDVKAYLAGAVDPPDVPHPYFAASKIVPAAREVLGGIAAEGNLRDLDRDRFVDTVTTVWARINHIHLFREGNTRSQFAFFRQLAAEAGYDLDTLRYRAAATRPRGKDIAAGDLRTKFIWGRFQYQQSRETTLLREALDGGLTVRTEANDLPVGPIIERGYDLRSIRAAMSGHVRPTPAMLGRQSATASTRTDPNTASATSAEPARRAGDGEYEV